MSIENKRVNDPESRLKAIEQQGFGFLVEVKNRRGKLLATVGCVTDDEVRASLQDLVIVHGTRSIYTVYKQTPDFLVIEAHEVNFTSVEA